MSIHDLGCLAHCSILFDVQLSSGFPRRRLKSDKTVDLLGKHGASERQ